MARKTPILYIYTIHLLITLCITLGATKANSAPTRTTKSQIIASEFIKSSCSSTTYPKTCVASLAMFSPMIRRDHSQLALTSLMVSLSRARSAHRFVTRFRKFKGLGKREREAIEDCAEEFDDAVDRLDKAAQELKGIKGSFKGDDFLWHMSNLQTWVSAALTDENTCLDGFAGKAMDGRVKTSITNHSRNLIEVTSNALALCNLYAQKKQ